MLDFRWPFFIFLVRLNFTKILLKIYFIYSLLSLYLGV